MTNPNAPKKPRKKRDFAAEVAARTQRRLEEAKTWYPTLKVTGEPKKPEEPVNCTCTLCGYNFSILAVELIRPTVQHLNRCPKCGRGHRAVTCIETGETYVSTAEAASQNELYTQQIVQACRNPNWQAGGKHWTYTDGLGPQKHLEPYEKDLEPKIIYTQYNLGATV